MSADLEAFDPKRTYREAAADYAVAVEKYWGSCSIETVDRLGLQPGDRILDAGCGPGLATIHAAHLVGPGGHAEGIDAVQEMLDIAQEKAEKARLKNITFTRRDFDDLPPGDESFDAAISTFSLFFAKDMTRTLRALMSHLRPGGVLAVTALTSELYEPVMPVFLDACRAEKPEISTYTPWTRLTDSGQLHALLTTAGAIDVTVESTVLLMDLPRPEHWWGIVLGSGMRQMTLELTPAAVDRVRATCEQWISDHDVSSIRLGVHYSVARKPQMD